MGHELEVDVQRFNEKTAIINLIGDMTVSTNQAIYDAYDEICRNGIRNVIFNFSKDDIIGTPGMAILIDVIVRAHKRNQKLLMAVPNAHFQRVFSMVGITRYAGVFSSLEEAKEQVS